MAEITQSDGAWTFDGGSIRIVPGRDKSVGPARQMLGELTVPLLALAGIAHEPGRRSGRLRLKLREGADPLIQVTGGTLPDAADPYQLSVEQDRTGVAEYMVEEVRRALLLDQVPSGPCDRYLMPGPSVPLSAAAGDATAGFDGEQVRLEWNWKTEESKKSGGTRTIRLTDLEAVEWQPAIGLENGYLRFRTARAAAPAAPKYDPHAVVLYGFKKDPLMALVAAAVTARLPHPGAAGALAAEPADAVPALSAGDRHQSTHHAHSGQSAADGPGGGDTDHDALLRRLRELGDLHRSGVLTEEEFTAAKQAVLRRFSRHSPHPLPDIGQDSCETALIPAVSTGARSPYVPR
ncbi:DUF4429 domain-containing protein [Streptomyces coffeae]|uniref:DUF4429 domain-containing protein n=1 Tax=Streptomyces coffeae TaxID=621382 RepID=A0ABS1ND51_9ACTN|nr:DUF4429 domain-containing protein [Streptomyces coffeae]MBL1098015.1 DUF4429 domain-containing protein [Streptomyces coffeae]